VSWIIAPLDCFIEALIAEKKKGRINNGIRNPKSTGEKGHRV
jgi:hypothetical protein